MKIIIIIILLLTGFVSCASVNIDFPEIDYIADSNYNIKQTYAKVDSISEAIKPKIAELNKMEQIKYISSFIHDSLQFSYIDVPFDSIAPYYGFLSEIISAREGNCMGFSSLYFAICSNLGIDVYAMTYPKHILLTFDYNLKDYYIETTSGFIHGSTEYLNDLDTIKPGKWDKKPLNSKQFHALYVYNVCLEISKRDDYDIVFKLMKDAFMDYSEPDYMADLYAFSAFRTGHYETAALVYADIGKDDRFYSMNINASYISWGNQLAEKGDFQGALDKYYLGLDKISGDKIAIDNIIAVSNNYAVELAKSGDYIKAEGVLHNAETFQHDKLIDNAFVFLYNTWGNDYFSHNNFNKAISVYVKALGKGNDLLINDNIEAAYYNWGIMLLESDDTDTAEKIFKKIFKYKSNSAFANNGLGSASFSRGDYKNAGKYFEKSIEAGDNRMENYYSAGISYYNDGDYKKAKEILNKGLSLSEDREYEEKIQDILNMMK